HPLERRRDFVLQINIEMRTAFRDLAFSADRHSPREVLDELTFIEMARCA
ncbi:MAG: hypothetical protein JWN13_6230, partial [Betaproteobacteria bacterium]|nr:hypothetical protein [Betaproteobacteria bacterium]